MGNNAMLQARISIRNFFMVLVWKSEIFQRGFVFVAFWEADMDGGSFDEFDKNGGVEFSGVAEVAFGDGVFSHRNIVVGDLFLPSTRRAGE